MPKITMQAHDEGETEEFGQRMRQWEIRLSLLTGEGAKDFGYHPNAQPGYGFPYYRGLGLDGAPTAAEVLTTLQSDCSMTESTISFEDWCADFGYNDDSIRDNEVYTLTVRQTEAVQEWLGEWYDEFLETDEDEWNEIDDSTVLIGEPTPEEDQRLYQHYLDDARALFDSGDWEYSADDVVAKREFWNDFVDMLNKDGVLTSLQVEEWDNPF